MLPIAPAINKKFNFIWFELLFYAMSSFVPTTYSQIKTDSPKLLRSFLPFSLISCYFPLLRCRDEILLLLETIRRGLGGVIPGCAQLSLLFEYLIWILNGDIVPLRHSLLQLASHLLRLLLDGQHELGHFAPGILHNIGDATQFRFVVLREIGDSLAFASSASSSPDAMNVRNGGWRKIVIDDQIHAEEINATSNELRANEHPHFAFAERLHHIVSLLLRAVGMNHIHVDGIVNQLRVQLLGTVLKESMAISLNSILIWDSMNSLCYRRTQARAVWALPAINSGMQSFCRPRSPQTTILGPPNPWPNSVDQSTPYAVPWHSCDPISIRASSTLHWTNRLSSSRAGTQRRFCRIAPENCSFLLRIIYRPRPAPAIRCYKSRTRISRVTAAAGIWREDTHLVKSSSGGCWSSK